MLRCLIAPSNAVTSSAKVMYSPSIKLATIRTYGSMGEWTTLASSRSTPSNNSCPWHGVCFRDSRIAKSHDEGTSKELVVPESEATGGARSSGRARSPSGEGSQSDAASHCGAGSLGDGRSHCGAGSMGDGGSHCGAGSTGDARSPWAAGSVNESTRQLRRPFSSFLFLRPSRVR
jgi:hypothetical protein